MKKLRKLLAGFMVLVLAITMVPMLAPITANATNATPDTITGTTGSLTIHKYEYNGVGGTATGSSSDSNSIIVGSTGSDSNQNAIPLDDVTFRITYVSNLDMYYTQNSTGLPEVSTFTGDDKTYNDSYFENTSNKVTSVSGLVVGKWMEVTTANGGTVATHNLPLGIYLVQEIDAPAQITGKTQDFLVSIPMTDVTGDKWLYDVHVYPKNSSTYASVTLEKKGKIGNSGNSENTSALVGAKFVLQSRSGEGTNDSPYTWTTVKKDNKGGAVGEDGVLTTNDNGKVTVSDLAPGTYRFVETNTPDNSGYIMDGETTYEFVIDNDGKVLIEGTETDTTQKPIEVINYQPDMDKQVKEKSGIAQEAADYSVGDDVPYVITIDIPENIEKLKTFSLTDVPNGLTYNTNSATVYDNADSNKADINTDGTTRYTIATSGSGFTIAFVPEKMGNYKGKTIKIEYTAKLKTGADTTTTGNRNTATLTYSNEIIPTTNDGNPNEPDDPDNPGTPSTSTIKDEAVVYTFKLKVNKTDNASPTNALSGVEFDVYSYSGIVTSPTETELKANGTVIKHIITDEDGYADVDGLENGTYYLVETKTNSDYNLLKAPVAVTIAVSYKATWSESNSYDANGNLTKHAVSAKNETFNDAADISKNGFATTTIINSKGFTLPTTGGVGTYIFIFVGVSMMAAAVILFIISKRKDAAKRM